MNSTNNIFKALSSLNKLSKKNRAVFECKLIQICFKQVQEIENEFFSNKGINDYFTLMLFLLKEEALDEKDFLIKQIDSVNCSGFKNSFSQFLLSSRTFAGWKESVVKGNISSIEGGELFEAFKVQLADAITSFRTQLSNAVFLSCARGVISKNNKIDKYNSESDVSPLGDLLNFRHKRDKAASEDNEASNSSYGTNDSYSLKNFIFVNKDSLLFLMDFFSSDPVIQSIVKFHDTDFYLCSNFLLEFKEYLYDELQKFESNGTNKQDLTYKALFSFYTDTLSVLDFIFQQKVDERSIEQNDAPNIVKKLPFLNLNSVQVTLSKLFENYLEKDFSKLRKVLERDGYSHSKTEQDLFLNKKEFFAVFNFFNKYNLINPSNFSLFCEPKTLLLTLYVNGKLGTLSFYRYEQKFGLTKAITNTSPRTLIKELSFCFLLNCVNLQLSANKHRAEFAIFDHNAKKENATDKIEKDVWFKPYIDTSNLFLEKIFLFLEKTSKGYVCKDFPLFVLETHPSNLFSKQVLEGMLNKNCLPTDIVSQMLFSVFYSFSSNFFLSGKYEGANNEAALPFNEMEAAVASFNSLVNSVVDEFYATQSLNKVQESVSNNDCDDLDYSWESEAYHIEQALDSLLIKNEKLLEESKESLNLGLGKEFTSSDYVRSVLSKSIKNLPDEATADYSDLRILSFIESLKTNEELKDKAMDSFFGLLDIIFVTNRLKVSLSDFISSISFSSLQMLEKQLVLSYCNDFLKKICSFILDSDKSLLPYVFTFSKAKEENLEKALFSYEGKFSLNTVSYFLFKKLLFLSKDFFQSLLRREVNSVSQLLTKNQFDTLEHCWNEQVREQGLNHSPANVEKSKARDAIRAKISDYSFYKSFALREFEHVSDLFNSNTIVSCISRFASENSLSLKNEKRLIGAFGRFADEFLQKIFFISKQVNIANVDICLQQENENLYSLLTPYIHKDLFLQIQDEKTLRVLLGKVSFFKKTKTPFQELDSNKVEYVSISLDKLQAVNKALGEIEESWYFSNLSALFKYASGNYKREFSKFSKKIERGENVVVHKNAFLALQSLLKVQELSLKEQFFDFLIKSTKTGAYTLKDEVECIGKRVNKGVAENVTESESKNCFLLNKDELFVDLIFDENTFDFFHFKKIDKRGLSANFVKQKQLLQKEFLSFEKSNHQMPDFNLLVGFFQSRLLNLETRQALKLNLQNHLAITEFDFLIDKEFLIDLRLNLRMKDFFINKKKEYTGSVFFNKTALLKRMKGRAGYGHSFIDLLSLFVESNNSENLNSNLKRIEDMAEYDEVFKDSLSLFGRGSNAEILNSNEGVKYFLSLNLNGVALPLLLKELDSLDLCSPSSYLRQTDVDLIKFVYRLNEGYFSVFNKIIDFNFSSKNLVLNYAGFFDKLRFLFKQAK